MLDRRASVMAVVPPAGLALGLALWLVFGRASTADAVEALQARLNALPLNTAGAAAGVGSIGEAIAKPLFALTTGPGAVAEIPVRLQGIARSPYRRAALLAIAGQPAAWVEEGTSVNGVILQEVSGAKVVIDTPLGLREVKLGEAIGPESSPAGAASEPQEIPPGYRSPPQPASAPAMGG